MRDAASSNPARSLILYLGDNAYPQGLPEKDAPGRAAAELRLNTQVDAARASGAATIFIPGNHDWAEMRSEGWDQVGARPATWSDAGVTASASSRKMAARARSPWTSDQACGWSAGYSVVAPRAREAGRPDLDMCRRLGRRGARGAARCGERGNRPARLRGGPSPARRPAGRTEAISPWPITCSRCASSRSGCGCRCRSLARPIRWRARTGSARRICRAWPTGTCATRSHRCFATAASRFSGRPRPWPAGALRGRRPQRARQRLGELRSQQRRKDARQHALRRRQAGLHAGGCPRGRANPPRRAPRRRRRPHDGSICHVARLNGTTSRPSDVRPIAALVSRGAGVFCCEWAMDETVCIFDVAASIGSARWIAAEQSIRGCAPWRRLWSEIESVKMAGRPSPAQVIAGAEAEPVAPAGRRYTSGARLRPRGEGKP